MDNHPTSVWIYVHPDFISSYDDEELKERLESVETQYKAQKDLILKEMNKRSKRV